MDHEIGNSGSGIERVFFSTDAFPQRKRFAKFREYVGNRIVRLDSRPFGENTCIDGMAMTLPGVGVVAVSLTPMCCARTRETMRDGNDNLRLVMLRRSASSAPAAHLGMELTVEPGSVLSNCDLNAITFTASRSRMISLNFTRKHLRPLLRDFDSVLAHTVPRHSAPLRFLASYVEALVAENVRPTGEFGQLTVAHIYDLAALAMGATRDAAEIAHNRGLAAARLRQIKSHITANLSRDNLSVGEIALRQHVTARYVQLLFENEGTTLTEFVRNARLKRAYRMLIDPCLADPDIRIAQPVSRRVRRTAF